VGSAIWSILREAAWQHILVAGNYVDTLLLNSIFFNYWQQDMSVIFCNIYKILKLR